MDIILVITLKYDKLVYLYKQSRWLYCRKTGAKLIAIRVLSFIAVVQNLIRSSLKNESFLSLSSWFSHLWIMYQA